LTLSFTLLCRRRRCCPCVGGGATRCDRHPDGEDEGGQASSSLAVSTRWISVAKLLQSDLATLVQREGGE
ncbi:hypothetical protein BHE74_00024605, partial [Ensete ventricosum]